MLYPVLYPQLLLNNIKKLPRKLWRWLIFLSSNVLQMQNSRGELCFQLLWKCLCLLFLLFASVSKRFLDCITFQVKIIHWVKFVQIRSFFWSQFPFIHSEYRNMWTRKDSGFRQFSRSDFRIIKAFQNFFFFRFCNLLFLGHLESEMKNFNDETGKSLERTNNIISELCLELLCCLPLPEFIPWRSCFVC